MILRARFHRSILPVERLNFFVILFLVLVTSLMSSPSPSWAQVTAPKTNGQGGRVTLDFNEVDLPVVIRFISELTGKNIVVDETAKKNSGKITIFSPTKVTVDQAYHMFLAALEVNRLTAISKGNVVEIVQTAEAPPERAVFVYKLRHANATDVAALLTNLVARAAAQPVSTQPGATQFTRMPSGPSSAPSDRVIAISAPLDAA